MVSSSGLIEMIAKKLKEYKAENIVVDPVMVAISGATITTNAVTNAVDSALVYFQNELGGGSNE